ncbi:DUF507 family protein [Deltaproteobacteria bacterium PRO3]|nr:MAG: DUF507 family protein [bacterium]MDL1870726.1 DUF507 family protein [Deltaproteobacteria bacterium PRO3]
MKLSEERVSHLAHLVWDALYDEDLVDYPNDEEALKAIKRAMLDYLKTDDQIDDLARQKILSQKRGIQEGSREWDILYRKYYEEEAAKKRF